MERNEFNQLMDQVLPVMTGEQQYQFFNELAELADKEARQAAIDDPIEDIPEVYKNVF